ncbi:alpha/beta hydrolase [Deinococcus taeanensis]|uniref:alpha/beta hydrolase n=1 Tax=Deinococcus taeanensis TaxID=2737050 RepID=UPI001CDCBBD0|nr:alpha/beta hydrolase-fold protein [Deinococcus taeanensis]UBV42113.1 alpha/beta hydrolase [Deinococcus taeanensis]
MPRLTVHLTVPPGTPSGQAFLTGDHRGWSSTPTGWTFTPAGTLHADFPEGQLLNLKVRLQRPDGTVTEEGDPWGQRAPAHRAVLRGDTTLTLKVAGWQTARLGRSRPSRCAPPREELTLPAPWGSQPVRLWWPDGHDRQTLPLLILHDGQNVFDDGPTFAGESWDAAGAAQAMTDAGLPLRVAALPVNHERSRRYVPFPFEMNAFSSGADEYADWLRQTLLPHLHASYGHVPAARTALAGSSFGGLITAYAGLRDPGTYGTLGVFSPAVWPAGHQFLRWLDGRADPGARVWIDMGDHEGSSLAQAQDLITLARALTGRLRPHVREAKFTTGEGHWHDEPAWRARLPLFLNWWLTGLN